MIINSEEIDSNIKNFIRDGYIIIKNAIGKELYEEMWDIAIKCLKRLEGKGINSDYDHKSSIEEEFHQAIIDLIVNYKLTPYEIQINIWKDFLYQEMPEKILRSSKLLIYLKEILGSDLQYSQGTALTISLPRGACDKNNYLFRNTIKKYGVDLR